MSTKNKYWKGIEELRNDESFVASKEQEFTSYEKPTDFVGDEKAEEFKTDRRDFLKYLGFGVTAATLAACEAPVQKAIPYVIKPEEVEPGLANYYASSFYNGTDYASILVKTREGRPIFISGNKESNYTKGAVNARVNSSVLELYDSKRAVGFMKNSESGFEPISHAELDKAVVDKLEEINAKGGKLRLLTNTIISPSTMAAVEALKAKYSAIDFGHVQYDSISASATLGANEKSFGKATLPSYDYSKAKVIVSIGEDFIHNGVNALAHAKPYADRRNPDGEWMSKHFQFEGSMSVSGSNADFRTIVSPSEQLAVIANLFNEVSATKVSAPKLEGKAAARVKKAADELKKAKGASIVVSDINNESAQLLVKGINQALNNFGSTISFAKEVFLKQGKDQAILDLVKEMNSGSVDAVLVAGTNPIYNLPASVGFEAALAKVDFKLSFADRVNDETAKKCDLLAADHHYLESWNDLNPASGEYSFQQPTIKPLFDTRQFQDSLLTWAGESVSYYDFIQANWSKDSDLSGVAFGNAFNKMIHDGAVSKDAMSDELTMGDVDFAGAASKLAVKAGAYQLHLYMPTSLGDGSHASNPWLHELPDPLTKVTWDNYIAMAPETMEATFGFNTMLGQKQKSNVAKITVNGVELQLPVVAQPGMHPATVAVALGYGRDCGYEESMKIGQNAASFMSVTEGNFDNYLYNVEITATEEVMDVASTQTHHTMMGRKIVNEVSLDKYKNVKFDDEVNGWNKPTKVLDSYGVAQDPEDLNLWSDHAIELGHRWGMSIDLNACTGCSACVTSCHSENNVAVVGKDEVNRGRDMHWLRIDRYYSTEEGDAKAGTEEQYSYDYDKLEVPSNEPRVVHQPVMCQHCNHAPCETVCPVAATTHSEEGLNQMAYNRCFGTRYCANNCPYKVRRFNWFNFTAYKKFTNFNPSTDDLGRMVLNPDVVVRTRGVMEKCSMCVQRIQSGKLEAKKAGKPVQDGAIQTACSEACAFGAITFGDLNDKESKVNGESNHERAYNLIEEVGVQPNIWYQTMVRNIDTDLA